MTPRKFILTGQALRIIALMVICLFFITSQAFPAMAQGFTVQFGNQEFNVQPGDRFAGLLPVTNTSEEPLSVRIFVGDWVRVPGQVDYNATEGPGDEPRSLITWMTYSPDSMTLQPGETRDIFFDVNVPEDVTLSGSYWDLIYVEGIPTVDPDAPPPDPEQVGIGIRAVFRYVIRVMATIENTETRAAAFTSLNFEPIEGGFRAIAGFQNDSNIFIKPRVWLELRDPTGEVIYTEEHIAMTVLPESARNFTFELKDLPVESGDYLVMIIADYGALNYIAAQGRLSLAVKPPSEESATTGDEGSGETGEGSPSG